MLSCSSLQQQPSQEEKKLKLGLIKSIESKVLTSGDILQEFILDFLSYRQHGQIKNMFFVNLQKQRLEYYLQVSQKLKKYTYDELLTIHDITNIDYYTKLEMKYLLKKS